MKPGERFKLRNVRGCRAQRFHLQHSQPDLFGGGCDTKRLRNRRRVAEAVTRVFYQRFIITREG